MENEKKEINEELEEMYMKPLKYTNWKTSFDYEITETKSGKHQEQYISQFDEKQNDGYVSGNRICSDENVLKIERRILSFHDSLYYNMKKYKMSEFDITCTINQIITLSNIYYEK